MYKNKKIISLVLSVILLLTAFPQCILASEETPDINNMMSILLEDPGLTALSVIDVFDKNEALSNATKPMSRREFAYLAVKLMAMDNAADISKGKRYFYDVSIDDEYAPYMYAAASQGIVVPKNTNYFSPEAAITKSEVASALLNILGYTYHLQLSGNTEQGVLSLAAKYGVTDNVGDGSFSTYDVYTMIKNALDIPVLEMDSIGKSISFTKNQDIGILAVYHNIYEDYGIVTANSNTGLRRINDNTKSGYVKIGDEMYALTDFDYSEFLGHQIMFYYQKPEGNQTDKKLIYAEDDETEVLKLIPADIEKFENMTYHYWDEKGKLRKASVKSADIIYNDTAVEGYSYEYIPQNGDVTLIDRNNDDDYEVIIINNYVDTVVLGAVFNENVVYFKSVPFLDLDDYPDLRIINWPNMAALNVKGFRYMQSASIAYGVDGEVKKIVTYFSDLVGYVDAIRTEADDETYAEINGKEYPFAQSYYENVENGVIEKAEIGNRGKFYLNYKGEIFDWDRYDGAFNEGTKVFEVAIFDNIAIEGGLDETIIGRFYTAIDNFETITFAEKVIIDSKVYTEYEDIREQFCIDGENGTLHDKPVKQFVRIKKNVKGEIIEVDKVGSRESGGMWKMELAETWDKKHHFSVSSRMVGQNRDATLSRDTVVISCPVNENGELDMSDVYSMAYKDARETFDYATRFELDIYRVGEDDPDAVLVHRKEAVADEGTLVTGVFIVRSIKRKFDNYGDERTCIEVSENPNKMITYFIDEQKLNVKEISLPGRKTHKLGIGDVIRIYANGNNAVQIQVVYDKENDIRYNTTADGSSFSGSDNLLVYGYAKRRKDERVLFAAGEPGEMGNEYAFGVLTDIVPVFVYNSEENRMYRGHMEQITDYFNAGGDCTRFYVRFDTQNDMGPKAIIIYK